MGEHLSQEVRSITTSSVQQLLLTREEMGYVSGRRICLLDDVVSTGSTLRALEAITRKAEGDVVCRAAIWREGPWYDQEELVCLGLLPVYVSETNELSKMVRRPRGTNEGRS